MEILWILPLIVGAILWAVADVISDGVIGEHGHSSHQNNKKSQQTDDPELALDLLSDNNQSQSDSRIKMEKDGADQEMISESSAEVKLTGEQDALLSGIVMFFCGLVLHIYYGSESVFAFMSADQLQRQEDHPNMTLIAPSTVYWASLISGVFQSFSLIYLLKAFESSSSTVIVPLMQLNSIFVLPLSIILSILSHYFPTLSTFDRIISPLHLFAFTLIFIGGFYPALEGEWSQFSRSFWRQRAVTQVLLSDLLIAIYYLIVSFCTNESGGMTSFSFLVISIYGNSFTFLLLVLFVSRYRKAALSLMHIKRKFILLSALGELFSLSGYFFVSISYHLYYNSGVVSATEGALNQLFNLLLAIVLKRFFNFGRDVKRIKEKLYSCIIVTIGLVLTST